MRIHRSCLVAKAHLAGFEKAAEEALVECEVHLGPHEVQGGEPRALAGRAGEDPLRLLGKPPPGIGATVKRS